MAEYAERKWVRVLGVRVLELRDPNSGQSGDPEDTPRHQYCVVGGLLLRRVMPPAAVGEPWVDDAVAEPWWEPVLELPSGGPVLQCWSERADDVVAQQYAWTARHMAGHVVAYTPNGREVRRASGGGLEVQPPNDNYWLRGADLVAIRRAFYGGGYGTR